MSLPKFANIPHSFYGELKTRIGDYFEQKGRATTGNFALFLKAVILLSAYAALYIHLVFFTPPTVFAIFEAFPNIAGRDAHVAGGGGDILRNVHWMNELLAQPAEVEKVDILLSKPIFAT